MENGTVALGASMCNVIQRLPRNSSTHAKLEDLSIFWNMTNLIRLRIYMEEKSMAHCHSNNN